MSDRTTSVSRSLSATGPRTLAVPLLAIAGLVAGCSDAEGSAAGDPPGESAAQPLLGQGLRGEYFDDAELTSPKLTRLDPTVSFDWGRGAPDPSMQPDTFSVRWTGTVTPKFSETYTFHVRSDDGARLTIGGTTLIDNWKIQPATEVSATIAMVAGRPYDIRLEYYDNQWNASCALSWSSARQAKEIVPASALAPPAACSIVVGAAEAVTSIQDAVRRAEAAGPAGKTICVRDDKVYEEQVRVFGSGTRAQPFVLTSHPANRGRAVIDGAGRLAGGWGTMLSLRGDDVVASDLEVKNGLGVGVTITGARSGVRNLDVHHHAERGVGVFGADEFVEKSRVWWNAWTNCRLPDPQSVPFCRPLSQYANGGWGTGLSAMRHPHGAVLRGNTVFNNWGEGLSTFEADGTVMEDNVVYDNWAANIYVSDVTDATVRRNVSYTTPAFSYGRQGINLAINDETGNPRSARNRIVNNLFLGSGVQTGLAWWTDPRIPALGMDDILVAHNTFVTTDAGGARVGLVFGGRQTHRNVRFVNNIVEQGGSAPIVQVTAQGITFANNLWSRAPTAAAGSSADVVGDPLLAKGGPVGPGQLSPTFFRLSDGSRAVNAGASAGVLDDFFKSARTTQPDIGAHELR